MSFSDRDVMYVQNPAIGAALLWGFVCGYYSNENGPVPFPIFQRSHENVMDDVNALCDAVEQIESTTREMDVVPAAFEREMQIVQEQIQEQTDKLEAIQNRIKAESQSLAIHREESYTLESISRFLGRIDAAINTYERIGTDSELQTRLDGVNSRIKQLKKK